MLEQHRHGVLVRSAAITRDTVSNGNPDAPTARAKVLSPTTGLQAGNALMNR